MESKFFRSSHRITLYKQQISISPSYIWINLVLSQASYCVHIVGVLGLLAFEDVLQLHPDEWVLLIPTEETYRDDAGKLQEYSLSR